MNRRIRCWRTADWVVTEGDWDNTTTTARDRSVASDRPRRPVAGRCHIVCCRLPFQLCDVEVAYRVDGLPYYNRAQERSGLVVLRI